MRGKSVMSLILTPMCVWGEGGGTKPPLTLVIRLPLVPCYKLELHVPGHTLVGWSTFM